MTKPKTLRLVLFTKCNRSCEGCCNNDWDMDGLEQINDINEYREYESIMLTGGEPMLNPKLVIETVQNIRAVNPSAKVIMYTAKSKRALDLVAVLHVLDGITLTLHEQYDVKPFMELDWLISTMNIKGKSLRLNVFSNVDLSEYSILSDWGVKQGIEWITNCPLPTNEIMKRL